MEMLLSGIKALFIYQLIAVTSKIRADAAAQLNGDPTSRCCALADSVFRPTTRRVCRNLTEFRSGLRIRLHEPVDVHVKLRQLPVEDVIARDALPDAVGILAPPSLGKRRVAVLVIVLQIFSEQAVTSIYRFPRGKYVA
jgi:hypothetical protein